VIDCAAVGTKDFYWNPSDSHSGIQKSLRPKLFYQDLPYLHTYFRNICMHLMTCMHKNVCTYTQGRTGHITRWEKSHGAPLVWGPLRQSGPPQHHALFLFFLDQLKFVNFLFGQWQWPFKFCFNDLFFLGPQFFFGGLLKKSHQNLGSQSTPAYTQSSHYDDYNCDHLCFRLFVMTSSWQIWVTVTAFCDCFRRLFVTSVKSFLCLP
jgi:hypothetical protein